MTFEPLPTDEVSSVELTSPPRIAALVLAAGQSTRMGNENKLLAGINGTSVIKRVVRAATASQAEPVLVVTGHEGEKIEAELESFEVTFVPNPDFKQGLSTSLRRGLAQLPEDMEGVIVCLGDMPFVSSTIIDSLISPFNPTKGKAICIPVREGKRGNPVLFAKHFFQEMQAVSGDMGARALIKKYPEFVHEIAIFDDSIHVDIDDRETLKRVSDKKSFFT